jgi:hypothetical protein
MFLKLVVAFCYLTSINALWLLDHNALVYERLDPLKSPGVVSGHVHTVVGGDAFAPTMDFSKTQSSSCTTSMVQDDKRCALYAFIQAKYMLTIT